MGMQVNTNIAANNAYRNLATTQNDLSKSLEKLSSGLRINRAADDAAGLAISEGLKSQVGGLTVAARNAQDGVSVIQTAEGSLNEVTSILQRMRDLAVQAGNDSNNAESRRAITTEATALTEELTRIGDSTNFNGTSLLNGAGGSAGVLSFQIGANGDASSQIAIDLSQANVTNIATDLQTGPSGTTGSSFTIASHGDLTTGAATFSSVNATTGTSISVTTDALDFGKTDAGVDRATPGSVDAYAAALRADERFSANFSVSVTKDSNGAGTGIVVSARDGGVVNVDDGDPATPVKLTPAAGIVGDAAGVAAQGGLDFSSAEGAAAAISTLDAKISSVSTARAELGAVQNRFESVIKNLAVSKENLTAAGSRIRDTDMAEEMVKYTRANILSQAGTAMLAQANQSNSGVLQLLQ